MLILLLFGYLARTGKLAQAQNAFIKLKYYYKGRRAAFVRVLS